MTDIELVRRLEQIERDQQDCATFCRESLTVSSKSGLVVPLNPGPAQVRLFDSMDAAREANKPFRGIYLKARQVWVSTAFEASLFSKLPFHSGQRAKVIAHDEEASTNIYGYFKQFLAGYKPFRDVLKLPRILTDADGHIKFANNSELMVATAGSPNASRSFQLRYLHLSEVAFWAHAQTLMNAALNSLTDDPGTAALIESTANGAGGYFYELWKEATDPARDSPWTPIFFAWWEHPEYVRAIDGDLRRFQDSLNDDERDLVAKYSLTLQQLAWRRWKIKEACGGSVANFHQEFPSTPDEAFLSSGRPRFSMKHVARMPASDPAFVGDLHEEMTHAGKKLYRVPNETGALSIWKMPDPSQRYVCGIDICEGIDRNAIGNKAIVGRENPDFSVLALFNADSGEQVAQLRGRIQPGAFAEEAYRLGKFYGWPFMVVEANGPGLAFLEVLTRLDYPLSRLYHRQADPSEKYSSESSNLLDKLGWKTGTVTRPQLVAKIDAAILEMGIFVHSAVAIAELRSFVIKPNGKPEAQDGDHDDCVIAIALAVEGMLTMPPDERLRRVARDELSKKRGPIRYGQQPEGDSPRGRRVRV